MVSFARLFLLPVLHISHQDAVNHRQTNNYKQSAPEQRFARGLGHGASQQHPPNWRRLTALASLSTSRKSGEPLQPKTSPPSRSSPPPLLAPAARKLVPQQRRLHVKILQPCWVACLCCLFLRLALCRSLSLSRCLSLCLCLLCLWLCRLACKAKLSGAHLRPRLGQVGPMWSMLSASWTTSSLCWAYVGLC